MIENIEQLKKDYEFDESDIDRIVKLKPIMEKYQTEFIDRFYKFIFKFPEAQRYLKNEEIIKRHREKVKGWFLDLFSGSYGIEYFLKLNRIGQVHVNIGLPTHYVNASFNFVRRFIIEKIDMEIEDRKERNMYVASVGKLLDMNLDMLTMAYREEELSKYAVMSPLEKKLFSFARKFADFIDLSILSALVIVAIFVVGLFFYDIYKLLFNIVPFEEAIVATLGSLLILWAVGELMNEEIKHFRGGGFALYAFIGIALAAMIRKLLIASLSPADEKKALEILSFGVVILILGIVYWLISKKRNESYS
ncbi:MAG: protoglobin domain-containing protein [Hydrogenothermaceae bacterium]|nr:protoglobin domain-containing protein [Hydrogenothermaceae bacterium]